MKKLLILAASVIAMLVAAPAAGAVDISVNTTADEYGNPPANCSLREAITSAQTNVAFGGCSAGSGADTITLPAGEYKITRAGADEDLNVTGDFDVLGTQALTIQPASSTAKVVVSGNGLDRVYDEQGNNSLALKNQTVKGGVVSGIGNDGGGIRNTVGSLSLDGVTISGNTTRFQGGGIAVYSSLSAINSTLSGNSADGNGGGLWIPGGATANVKSSTITKNTSDADNGGNGYGGGFADGGATSINFTNVINAGNLDNSPTAANDCYSGPVYFPRYSMQVQPFNAGNCLIAFDPGTNKVVTDPKLGPLSDNGGQTPTHALILSGPAIGAGGTTAPDTCPPTDQNGRVRPANSCDIGSVQYFEPPPPPPPPPPPGITNLKIVKIKPKPLGLKRGKNGRKARVVVRSKGVAATKLKLCLKLNRKTRKAITVKGKRCLKLARLDGRFTKKFKLTAKRSAKKGKRYKIRVVLSASNAKSSTGKIVIKVK